MADYFSRLPESLIHHILSFLPFNEICRTCVLSKYFNRVWFNYPNLDFTFDQSEFKIQEKAFFDLIDNSLGQCLVRKPFIQQLRLQILLSDVNNFTPKFYSVPQQVFVSRTLEVLDLTYCSLEGHRVLHIELPRLEKLSLSDCQISDNLLQEILSACPEIKHISLKECKRLFTFRRCGSKNTYKISIPGLKRLILHGPSYILNDKEIEAPNLHSFEFSFIQHSNFKFSSLSIPNAYDIHMKISALGFGEACGAGLQDFLMKLPNYEDLKLLIFNKPIDCNNSIMIVELRAVSFYSLQEFAKESRLIDIIISSRDETNLVRHLLTQSSSFRNGYTISMMCNSWQSVESYCKNLGNWSIVKDNYDHIELVSPAKILMSSYWKSFVKSNSRGINHRGAIILHASKG